MTTAAPLQTVNRDLTVVNPPQESPYILVDENRPPSPPVDFGIYSWRYPGYLGMRLRIKLMDAMRHKPRLSVRARIEKSCSGIKQNDEGVVVPPTAQEVALGEL